MPETLPAIQFTDPNVICNCPMFAGEPKDSHIEPSPVSVDRFYDLFSDRWGRTTQGADNKDAHHVGARFAWVAAVWWLRVGRTGAAPRVDALYAEALLMGRGDYSRRDGELQDMTPTKHWYLVHTRPKKEKMAEENLLRQGFEVYLPLIQQPKRRGDRWMDIVEPLFARYLFVRLRFGHDNIGPIRYTTGVRSLVRFSDEPAVVPDRIVESLKRIANCNSGVHRPMTGLFKPGDAVAIDKGPLAGLRSIFVADTNRERVIILLNMLGGEQRVTVERNLLRLA